MVSLSSIHGRKSRGEGGHAQEFVLGDSNDVRPPEFSTCNVLDNTVCRLFILIKGTGFVCLLLLGCVIGVKTEMRVLYEKQFIFVRG